MEPNELADHIKTMADLDKLVILNNAGRPCVRFGWNIGLFFEKGETLEKRLAANDVLRDFLQTFAGKITHYHPPELSKLKKIGDLDLPVFCDDDARAMTLKSGKNNNDSYATDIYGFDGGKQVMEPAPLYLGISTTWRDYPISSSIKGNIPLTWQPEENYAAFVALYLRWCNIVRPAHGTASPGPVLMQGGAGIDFMQAFPLLQRFPGLDYMETSYWKVASGDRYKASQEDRNQRTIRTIGWLTALDDEYINFLGGFEKMRSSLAPDVITHRYDGGFVLQAGERPTLGDRNRGIVPAAYKNLSTLVKPLIFRDFKFSFWRDLSKNFNRIAEKDKWLDRFD